MSLRNGEGYKMLGIQTSLYCPVYRILVNCAMFTTSYSYSQKPEASIISSCMVELNTPVFYSCYKTFRKIDSECLPSLHPRLGYYCHQSSLQIKANAGKIFTKNFFLFYWSDSPRSFENYANQGDASNKRLSLMSCYSCNTRCMSMYALIREGLINVCY